jgi:hypothetical protein
VRTTLLIVALFACGKAEPQRPDFASWDMPAKQKAWQGAFVIDDGREAMSIRGDQVTNWDGDKEFTFTLELVSPCSGWLVEGGVKNGFTYTVVDGALRYTGVSGGGYRRGKEAIVCRVGVYLLDAAGTCTYWQERAGAWAKTPGRCGFRSRPDGSEVFFVLHEGINEIFTIEGDSLVPPGLATQKVADYATAKAAVDAKRKAQ